MGRFFGEAKIDESFAQALEKRMVAVYAHQGSREWRGVVWPMASFGIALIVLMLVVGGMYVNDMERREWVESLRVMEGDLGEIYQGVSEDKEISEAIEYASM